MVLQESLKSEKDLLGAHRDALLKKASQVYAKDFDSNIDISKKLPLVKWAYSEQSPSAFCLYLLCFSDKNRKTVLFFEEMVANWLVPGEQLHILSSQNVTFRLPHWKRALFFVEVMVLAPGDKFLHTIQRQLPILSHEIKLGILSSGSAKHILEMKRLSPAGKTSFIYETIVSLIRRWPKRFSHDIFREIQHFLVHCREEFREIHDVRHLCRIISSHYLFQKAIEKDRKDFPHRRYLYLRLMKTHLHYPFGLKKVLGIALTLNSLRDYECFELRHILKAVQRLIPNVEAKQDSYYSNRNEENNLLSVYLEIEKVNERDFTLEELTKLKKELPNELKNSIEYLSPSLFIPRNEEELIRNIISLSAELRYVRDMPQAIISFQEQLHDVLKFNVILLRVVHSKNRTLQELCRHLPPKIRFIQERVANVGFIRKKYVKEANVFSLEVENQLFLRKNHSVDLVKARQYVVKALEKMIGPFRDYNGGFLLKQNEQLEAIKQELGNHGTQNEFLLDNLFYSLSPSIMQTYIPPVDGKNLCSLFLNTLDIDLPDQDACLLQVQREKSSVAIVIKASQIEIKDQLSESLKPMRVDSLKIASGTVEVDRNYYVCYLYLNPSPEEEKKLVAALEQGVQAWKEKRNSLQVIHVHIPRAANSLDPRIGADRTSGIVIKMLYEGLMRINEKHEIEKALAEEVIVTDEGRKYLFKLRPSVWSNGSPLTAFDFEYAWKKSLEPEFRSHYSFLFFPIKNGEAAKRGEKPTSQIGVKALDERTLLVELEYPAPYFLELTANWIYSPLCREIDQKHPGWAYHSGETYVCNGPFKLDAWKFNDDLQLIRNPLYWDASSVKLDRVQVSIIEDEFIAQEMFYRGKIDWIGDPFTKIPPKEIPKLKQKKFLHSEKQDHYGLFWLQLNMDRTPFKNANIRQAFARGVNRQILIDKVLQSEDIPAYRFHPKHELRSKPFDDGDIQAARDLFEKGLKELGFTRKDLPPIVISHSDITEHEELAKELGRQWQETFQLEVRLERLVWNTYFTALNKGDFMIGGLTWYPRFEDPIYFYDVYIYREHAMRIANWKNADYVHLVEKAKRTPVAEEREALLKEAEKILLQEMPVIPLFYQKFRYAKNPRLQGCILSNTNQIDFRVAYLEAPHEKK